MTQSIYPNTGVNLRVKVALALAVALSVGIFAYPSIPFTSAQSASTYLAAYSINGGSGTMTQGNFSLQYALAQSQPVGKGTSDSYSLESGSVPVMLTQTSPEATKLAFTTQPVGAPQGAAFTTQPVVTIQDSSSNTVATSGIAVTLSITPDSGHAEAALSGNSTVLTVDGVATFSGLSIDLSSPIYTLTASTPADLTGAVSSPFSVIVLGAATALGKVVLWGLFASFALLVSFMLRKHYFATKG